MRKKRAFKVKKSFPPKFQKYSLLDLKNKLGKS